MKAKSKVVQIRSRMSEQQVKEYVNSVTGGKRKPESDFEKTVIPSLLANIQTFEKLKAELIKLEMLVVKKKSEMQSLDGGINAIIGLLVSEENKRLNPPTGKGE